ncbi:MAG: pyrroline-5-carboxylate reductase [Clostridiales bacterium 42_27]|nr:MAG: pyrroline-5-carboxylate reductase [Clostridiales bacterium 42_27]
MMDTIGFLGCGNMGGAIARAVCKAVDPKKVFLANRTAAKAQALAKELGCKTATNAEVAGDCDLIFLAVKPQMMEALLEPLRFTLDERPKRFVLCSMAAGLSIARIQELAGEDFPVIRIMPNTPASVGEGMIQYCSSNVTAEEEEAGRLDAVPESLIDAASCVSGCGPAWVYQFIEALADGGVACGLPRTKAQEYAAQMVLGSAKLVLESGKHPGELKDAVCSPGGSTIQGVRVLEERGLRGAVMDAVIASYNKTKEMGKG